MPIDQQFVDVDFADVTQIPDGKSTGSRFETPYEAARNMPCLSFAETNIMIPQSEWRAKAEQVEKEIRSGVQRRHDQDGVGQCVAESTTYAMEFRAYFSMGLPHWVALSPSSLYSRIGTSNNSGAYVSDGAKYSQTQGVLPLSGEDYQHTMGEVGYSPRELNGMQGWQNTAKMFRAEWQQCNSREEMVSAMLQFKPVIMGRRGHSMAYIFIKYEGSTLYVAALQSWGEYGEVLNEKVGRTLVWDTWNNMARTGYACENVTIRSEVDLP